MPKQGPQATVDGVPAFLSGGGHTGELIRTLDWSRTPLGPIASWPDSLRTIVGTMLHSRHPMFLWWGAELIQFYNDAYLPSFGVGKHPVAMGQRGVDCWQEIWPIIWPQIEDVMMRGKPSWNEDQLVPIFRNGCIEEVCWTYGYSPIFVENGEVGGTLVVCTETTARVIAARRLRVLRALSDQTSAVTEAAQVYPAAAAVLSRCESDVPFALFYTREPLGGQATLVSSTGLDAEIVPEVDQMLQERLHACLTRKPACQGPFSLAGDLPMSLPGGPWPEPSTQVFIAEVAAPASTTHLAGVVVFGLSPRLPFDHDYRDFVLQLADHLTKALSRIEAFRTRAAVESERRNLLLQAPVATALLTGPEHRFELANPLYREMIGGREVVGKTMLEAFPELDGAALPGIFDHVYRSGEPYVTDELVVPLDRDGDGTPEDCFFKFNLEPLRDVTGSVYGMMAVAVDITEAVNARRGLESANRAKDEFLAMLGHELRNPLSPIVTALQLMKLRRAGAPHKEEEVIERQVTHLVRLVDDLLDVSKITRGLIDLKKEQIEISDVLAKAVEIASVLLEQRSHRLLIEVPRVDLRWYGDPVRLAQVVANLLTNAARYTPPGGRIELSAFADGHEIVISVKDNGCGISAEMLPRVFEMFVQAKRSADRSEGGLGLGLTLVKTLVSMHGGSVRAFSPGISKGSEFVIRLPRSGITSESVPVAAPAPRPTAASPPRRILVVDDNVDAADLLAEALALAGHQVSIAHDPIAALEQLSVAHPQVAVLDIGLPVMDGYELAARMREVAPDCRLLALSGYGQQHDIARSSSAGFERHLVKPVDVEELLRIVAR